MDTEADTCRKIIVPLLQGAGWDDAPCAINEQRTFTDGRVLFIRGQAQRGKRKRADYILRYRLDYPIAVIEAKAHYRSARDGVQQAKEYAEILGLRFAWKRRPKPNSCHQTIGGDLGPSPIAGRATLV